MRIIKSAVGVFICLLLDYFRGSSGIVFYSLLAVLWCIRDYVSETKRFALQRTVGTLIGALYGLLILIGSRYFTSVAGDSTGINRLLSILFGSSLGYSFIISVSIIVVLYTTVIIKQNQASYFSCVVFLSIVINHVSDVNPYLFVWNRFLDTMIGIVVGVCVNCFSFHRRKGTEVLFLSGLDDTLLAPGGEMSAYSRIELNRMIESGVNFTVSTIRTPASLLEPLRGINLTLPVIAMDGAALFNLSDNSYEKVYIISREHSISIQDYFNKNGLEYFANVVIEDVLLIYYQNSDNEIYNDLITKMRRSPYRNYIKMDEEINSNVVYFMLIDRTDKINRIYSAMLENELFRHFKITVTASNDFEGCSNIRIYNRNASKENMLDYLKEKLGISNTVTFGTVEGKYTHVIEAGDFNRVVKIMKKEI